MNDTARNQALTTLQRYYAAFNAGDAAAMLAELSPDVAHDINQGHRESGIDAFAAFLQRMNRCYSEQLHELRFLVSDDGRHAAAEFVVHGTYLATDEGLPEARGQSYVLPGGAFIELRDGRICRLSNYYNLQDWLAQVGAET
jgi:steroid delta-isomerase-like uncharacterized protein